MAKEAADRDMSLVRTKVNGNSMLPGLRHGQEILLSPVTPGELRLGDVLAIRFGHKVVLHRFLGIGPDGKAITRGDNSSRVDSPVPLKYIDGRLFAVKRGGGFWYKPRRLTALASGLLLKFGLRRLAKVSDLLLTSIGPSRPLNFVPDDFSMHFVTCDEELARTGDFETQELGEELVIYDRRSGDVHVLNAIAALIWKGIKSAKQEEQIISELCGRFPEAEATQVATDVRQTLMNLRSLRLIENA